MRHAKSAFQKVRLFYLPIARSLKERLIGPAKPIDGQATFAALKPRSIETCRGTIWDTIQDKGALWCVLCGLEWTPLSHNDHSDGIQ